MGGFGHPKAAVDSMRGNNQHETPMLYYHRILSPTHFRLAIESAGRIGGRIVRHVNGAGAIFKFPRVLSGDEMETLNLLPT